MSFPNVWHHRKVAETAVKACEICYRPSSSVLITPDNKDWFYVCPMHLKDTKFCTPIIDHEAIAARKKREEDEEIARLKKEYEEKQHKKKEKEAQGNKDNDGEKGKDKKDDKKDESKPGETGKKQEAAAPPKDEEPKVFTLQKSVLYSETRGMGIWLTSLRAFYQQRLNKKRQAEMAKKMRERMKEPDFFPAVPKDGL
ncbi:hypothetical protein DL771_009732 [Monosporascus sp. 5C6A]|nr:hypothetical protein DL771_009732 [Monosporascus sp. 5C6A]